MEMFAANVSSREGVFNATHSSNDFDRESILLMSSDNLSL